MPIRNGASGSQQVRAVFVAQGGAEMEDVIRDVVRLEVGLSTVDVDEASGREATFLEEHEPDPPGSTLDGLATASTLRLTARRALGPVDSGQAPVGRADAGHALQSLAVGRAFPAFRQPLEQGLGPLVRRAQGMEPQRHLALRERIGKALAEPELPARDGLAAAAALGATARGGLEKVGHGRMIPLGAVVVLEPDRRIARTAGGCSYLASS